MVSTDVNDVDYCVHDPTMAGVHDYNSARQVVDFPHMPDLIDMPDLIKAASDDDGDDFIPPSLTVLVEICGLMIVMIVKTGVLPV
jgi:hypothetical protein